MNIFAIWCYWEYKRPNTQYPDYRAHLVIPGDTLSLCKQHHLDDTRVGQWKEVVPLNGIKTCQGCITVAEQICRFV